ncbi:hypothetical protein PMG71_13000 [Roseofilum sp. BLCC_M154]|uniref:Uncharacterized protein n=1 Tax=Roseofilum acuticapitatum BLCC-M154 TaxID=3022444 RepID=A0ABT7ATZ4_9CYAN|nr:hypothetical protein [Roseofilum acuticapitatum]MDJ1170350.1 hypothetical protein [Roseofilum acuticapitatum BLCC-M154]
MSNYFRFLKTINFQTPIEASERTIGVTQARGGFTQVLGITNTRDVAS